MENREAIEILSRPFDMKNVPLDILEAHKMAIAALEKQEGKKPLAADVVEVRKGRWVLFDNAMSMWNVWVCSECGYRRKEGWMHTEAGKKPEAQYCENCMAKMDGSVNDGT